MSSLLVLLAGCAGGLGGGGVLEVGPTQRLKLPSQAAAAASAGDTIRIAPGDTPTARSGAPAD